MYARMQAAGLVNGRITDVSDTGKYKPRFWSARLPPEETAGTLPLPSVTKKGSTAPMVRFSIAVPRSFSTNAASSGTNETSVARRLYPPRILCGSLRFNAVF
jgi:hypothetical protein